MALSGGGSAELTGGNFWDGAVVGEIVAGLNHSLHDAMDDNENTTAKRSLTAEEKQKIGKNYPDYDNYPDAESVYKEVGGELYKEYLLDPEAYRNTCAMRLSVAFEKSNIDIGGEYNGKNGKKYYASATNIYKAIDSRFISTNQGFNVSNYGIGIQFKHSSYTGKVHHVDVVFLKNGRGVFGNTLYHGHYNKFY